MIVVADSTVLIGLAKLRQLNLLKDLFSKIFIPEEVCKEVVERGHDKPGSKLIRESPWVETKAVKDKTQVSFLMGSLDRGEAEVLALAGELEAVGAF